MLTPNPSRSHHRSVFNVNLPPAALGLVPALTISVSAFAATPARTNPAPSAAADNDAVQLSPFLVSSEGDDGYRAANTLSGTRMNASLFHTPAAISVLTKEFLDDIGAENVADMFKFAISTDNERTEQGGGLAQAFDVRTTIRGSPNRSSRATTCPTWSRAAASSPPTASTSTAPTFPAVLTPSSTPRAAPAAPNAPLSPSMEARCPPGAG